MYYRASFAKVVFLFFLELAFDLIDTFISQHLSGSSVMLHWDYYPQFR